MRHLVTLLLVLTCLLTADNALSQKKCSFQIDTAKILTNQNLDGFLTELKDDSFKITNNKKDIPKFIKKQLDCYTHGFRIANPDQPYSSSDVIVRNLPRRQLTFFAKSDDLMVMEYNLGGVGLSSHLLLVKYKDGKIIDLWKGICLQHIKSIQDAIGYLELNRNKEWGLNTNIVYF
jgi:hypothetical protein